MSLGKSLFEQNLFMEAPGDEEPDNTAPPDIPEDQGADDNPPDIPDEASGTDDNPPDIPDDMGGDMADGMMGGNEEGPEEQDPNKNMKLDAKVSSIMNVNLYQRYLTLLNTVNSQISMIKNNSDMIYSLSQDSSEIITALKKLDENIRLYMSNIFLGENYSRNLLFFNKCLNLLKLLNDSFESSIQKGIKDM